MATKHRSTNKAKPGIPLDPMPLAVIFDRWSRYALDMKVCDCAECERLRAKPFHCKVCGYGGQPLVHPCACPTDRRLHVQLLGERIAKAEAAECALKAAAEATATWSDGYDDGNEDDGVGDVAFLEEPKKAPTLNPPAKEDVDSIKNLPYMRRFLIECLTTDPNKLCPTSNPRCCHGVRECPVCVDGEEGMARGQVDPWAIIRDLRAALAGRPPSSPSSSGSHRSARVRPSST